MGKGNGVVPVHLTGEAPPEQVWYHNWLYSVIPADREMLGIKTLSTVIISEIYLVGYCKICNTAFSAPVPYDASRVTLSNMNIPKEGCSGPSV